ncbi:hypothetical protein [Flavisphingopyxis soli]|nr:hypothetical protein [Sphingorhabdus soli]
MMLALQIGLATYIRRREKEAEWRPLMSKTKAAAAAEPVASA